MALPKGLLIAEWDKWDPETEPVSYRAEECPEVSRFIPTLVTCSLAVYLLTKSAIATRMKSSTEGPGSCSIIWITLAR